MVVCGVWRFLVFVWCVCRGFSVVCTWFLVVCSGLGLFCNVLLLFELVLACRWCAAEERGGCTQFPRAHTRCVTSFV